MTTQELQHNNSTKKEASSVRLTPMGQAVLKAAGVVTATSVGVGALIGVGEALHGDESKSRITTNETILQQDDAKTLHGTVYLGEGVNVRTSMDVNNGDDGGTLPNIRFTVGNGDYKGQIVVINDPLHLEDADGNDWYAFEMPNTHPQTLKERAQNLVYVAASAIESENNSTDKLVINPNKDGSQVADTPVRFVGNEFYQANTNEVLPYELTATTIPDIGK